MTTHKDTTMLEKLTEVICEKRMDAAYEGCVNPCASLPCLCAQNIARAILNELKQPSPGMIAAAMRCADVDFASEFVAAIDFVLNEGEGK